VITPVNRLTQYYAEVAVASTVDYVGYCFKRLYPHGGVSWHHREDSKGSVLHCGIAADRHGHTYIVRFDVPVDAGAAQIKMLCLDAANVLDRNILAAEKTK
jgi:hypothetical protein